MSAAPEQKPGDIQRCVLGGYLGIECKSVPELYDAGFSTYVAAWPLLGRYPGNEFQTGLFGTWMHPHYDGPTPNRKLYCDIEGGLGWWRDTQYATETGLAEVEFTSKDRPKMPPYTTPAGPNSCWKRPGPVAGPFKARLGDGSTVVYYWYRFADQPALLNADLSDRQREELQRRVETLHAHWTPDREYLPPPRFGELAKIDPALVVTPPKGMEAGFVPIVTWQGVED